MKTKLNPTTRGLEERVLRERLAELHATLDSEAALRTSSDHSIGQRGLTPDSDEASRARAASVVSATRGERPPAPPQGPLMSAAFYARGGHRLARLDPSLAPKPKRARAAGPAPSEPTGLVPGTDEALRARVASVGMAIEADRFLEPLEKKLTLAYLGRGGYHQAAIVLAAAGSSTLALRLEAALADYLANPDNVANVDARSHGSIYAPNLSYDVAYKNGLRGIGKPKYDEALCDMKNLPRSAAAEVDAYRVDRRLKSFLVPVTVALEFPKSFATKYPEGSVQFWVSQTADLDAQLFEVLEGMRITRTNDGTSYEVLAGGHPGKFRDASIAKLKMLDFVLGNTDRGYVFNMRNTVKVGPIVVAIDNAEALKPVAIGNCDLNRNLDELSPRPYAYLAMEVMFASRGEREGNARRNEIAAAIDAMAGFPPDELAQMLEGRHHPSSVARAVERLEILNEAFRSARAPEVEALLTAPDVSGAQIKMFEAVDRKVRRHY